MGQVQAAVKVPDHGDADQGIRVGLEKSFGKALGLAPEDQAIAFLKLHFGVFSRGLGAEEPEPHIRMGAQKSLPILIVGGIQVFPIVKPRAAQIIIVGFETKGMDQMELRIVGNAKPTDAAGVLRNFRLVQNDVEQGAPNLV